jgi:hypothetical protein
MKSVYVFALATDHKDNSNVRLCTNEAEIETRVEELIEDGYPLKRIVYVEADKPHHFQFQRLD